MTNTRGIVRFVLLALFLAGGFAFTMLSAQAGNSVTGFYMSETGKTVFKVFESGGILQVQVYRVAPDANRNMKENLGKVIFDGMRRESGTQRWSDGKAYTYNDNRRVEQGSCAIESVEGGKRLKIIVRAGLLSKTAVWERAENPEGTLK